MLKRSFRLGLLWVSCTMSIPLMAQLPEVESLSNVPAWVNTEDSTEYEATEQRFESSFQSEPTENIGFQEQYSNQDINSSQSDDNRYAAPGSAWYPVNSPDTSDLSGSNVNSNSNFGAFNPVDNNAGYEMDTTQSYQPAETGGISSQAAQGSQDKLTEKLDPSNPMLSVFKKMEALVQEVQELRGKIEEQNFVIENLQQSQKTLYLDVDRRLREGGSAKVGSLSPVSVAEHNAGSSQAMQGGVDARVASRFESDSEQSEQHAMSAFDFSGGTASQAAQAEEQEIYQQAYQSIQSKDYDAALAGFKSLVKTYPKGQHAPNAYYWMGEIYLVQGELDLAAHAFDEVYQEFPQHPKASDALLKLGYVEYAKGQWIRSRNLLAQVKSQFPKSSSARLADTRLQRMHQEGRI